MLVLLISKCGLMAKLVMLVSLFLCDVCTRINPLPRFPDTDLNIKDLSSPTYTRGPIRDRYTYRKKTHSHADPKDFKTFIHYRRLNLQEGSFVSCNGKLSKNGVFSNDLKGMAMKKFSHGQAPRPPSCSLRSARTVFHLPQYVFRSDGPALLGRYLSNEGLKKTLL